LIGIEALVGVIEMIATIAILFAVWKFVGRIEADAERERDRR